MIEWEDLPEPAVEMASKNETYRTYITNLNLTIDWYNTIRRTAKKVELQLIQNKISKIDELISQGQNNLNWKSESNVVRNTVKTLFIFYHNILDLLDYVSSILNLVKDLQHLVKKTQGNLTEMQTILNACSRKPLYERKDGKKEYVLGLDDRKDKASKRYKLISDAAERIVVLLDDSCELFSMSDKKGDARWVTYVQYIDGIIKEHMFKAVGCRYFSN